jgi:hypothetical protein
MAVIHKLWHSFSQAQDYENEAKKSQEKVLLILRAHPITNVGWLLIAFLFFFLPLVFGDFLPLLNLTMNQELFIVSFYYAILFSYLLGNFYFWYFNLGVVTNRKIVDVDANNLLNTSTTATTISKVEEIEKKSLGLVSSIFNYGNVYVQTAGEVPNIEFLRVPDPERVVKIINSNMRIYGNTKRPNNS